MKILTVGNFPENTAMLMKGAFPEGFDVEVVSPDEAEAYLAETDVIIPEHLTIDAQLLNRAPKLKFVQTGAGYDNVDLEECTRRGILVCSAKGINANAVAEHTLALILSWYKNIPYLDGFMKSRRDECELDYSGAELRGRTMGIIGLGDIGRRTALLCRAFGMRVIAYNRSPRQIEGIESVGTDELLRTSDIVSLHIPASPETRHIINADALKMMKPSALLVNTSRGALVDEAALADALSSGEIAGACLDVFEREPLPPESPLRGFPNVILTPHTAGLPDAVKFHGERYAFFARNIEKFSSGKTPDNLLNGK